LKLKFWLIVKRYWRTFIFISLASFLFFNEYKKIKSETVNSWTQTTTSDCAVVLTGGPGRVREAFDLLERQQVKKLIISGVYQGATLREILPTWPFYPHLREENIVLEKRSETTFGNAQQSLPLVEALRCKDILLVTSRSHMYRAYRTFRGTYPETIPIFKHSIYPSKSESQTIDQAFEALKSLFYSLWAY